MRAQTRRVNAEEIVKMFSERRDEAGIEEAVLELVRGSVVVDKGALSQMAQFLTPGGELDRWLVAASCRILSDLPERRRADEWDILAGCARVGSRTKDHACRMRQLLMQPDGAAA